VTVVNVTSTITVVLVAQRVCEHERIEPIVFDRGDFVALPRLGGVRGETGMTW
jgi:hypothetical protein